MIEIYETPTGWRWRIKGRNGEIIATGEEYKTKFNVYRALGQLEYILTHQDDPVEIRLKHNPGDSKYQKNEQQAANEREKKFDDSFKLPPGAIRSPHPDRGML